MSAHAEAHEHHGPPPIHYGSRVSPSVLGMFLFIGSEIMLFGAFFTVYFFDRVVNKPFGGHWPPDGFHRPVFVAGINTLILVTSSATMHWADTSIKRGNRAGMQAGLVLTLCLGLTGLHGAHVFVGLSILTVMMVRAFRGHFSPEHHHGVEIGGIYWHFVDVMWIVVYVTVYLL